MGIIEVRNLSKKYKGNDFYSLKNANFSINKGDIIGLVGKNGAGKSTLLKLMTKAQRPTDGTVIFKGKNIFENNDVLENVGLMIDPAFFPYITVEDNLKLFLTIHKKNEYLGNIKNILELVDLWKEKDRKPINFSFGMKQRMALALALVIEPEFVLLDEPFVGLDPIGIQRLIKILQLWSKDREVSMIISSHQLSELEILCNRYIYIDSGKINTQLGSSQDTLVIKINISSSKELKAINNISSDYANYNIVFNKDVVEVPHNLNVKILNKLLQDLASKNLILNITSQKNKLEKLFTRD